MSYIKSFFNTLAYANIIISLGPVAFVYLITRLLQLPSEPLMFIIAFLIAFFVYSFNRLTDIKEDIINNPERAEFFKKRAYLFISIGIIALILALFLAILKSLLVFTIVLLPAIFVTIYSIKWIPQKQKRLKEIFLIKNILVSLGWFLISLFVAAYVNIFSIGILIIGLFIFLRIFIGCIMFDVRDIEGDKIHRIYTIPIKFGIKKTRNIILILNFISFVILPLFSLSMLTLAVSIVALLFGLLYYFKINKKIDMKFLCNVVVDGEYVILGLVPFLLSFFGI
jgi:4-hydroxybenzoate polyprenyltransferase